MFAPGRTDLLLFFEDREVEARLAEARAHRQSGGTRPDDGNCRSFYQLRFPELSAWVCSLLASL